MKCFVQSFESRTMLDSSILIAPLVFFISPCDPRFLNTLDRILLPPEKGGLTSTGLVYRYDTEISDDGKYFFPAPPYKFVVTNEANSCCRSGWSRGRIQHVYVLVSRGHDPGSCVRTKVSCSGRQSVREYAWILQPSLHVLGGDREEWRTAWQHTSGVQSPCLDQCCV